MKKSYWLCFLSLRTFQYCLISIAINIVPHVTGNVCLQFYHVKPRFRVFACITSSNLGKVYCLP